MLADGHWRTAFICVVQQLGWTCLFVFQSTAGLFPADSYYRSHQLRLLCRFNPQPGSSRLTVTTALTSYACFVVSIHSRALPG